MFGGDRMGYGPHYLFERRSGRLALASVVCMLLVLVVLSRDPSSPPPNGETAVLHRTPTALAAAVNQALLSPTATEVPSGMKHIPEWVLAVADQRVIDLVQLERNLDQVPLVGKELLVIGAGYGEEGATSWTLVQETSPSAEVAGQAESPQPPTDSFWLLHGYPIDVMDPGAEHVRPAINGDAGVLTVYAEPDGADTLRLEPGNFTVSPPVSP